MSRSPPHTIDRPSRRRVLHVVYWLRRGGIETWLLNLISSQPVGATQHDIVCVGPEKGELAGRFEAAGSRVLHCPMSFNPFQYASRLERLLANTSYDLVHVHTGIHSGPPVHAAKQQGIPTVALVHNTRFLPGSASAKRWWIRPARNLYGRLGLRYAIQQADFAAGVSQGVVDAVNQFTGSRARDFSVLYLGVTEPTILPTERRKQLRESLGLGKEDRVVLHVGSFRKPKNHSGLLRIFNRVRAAIPKAKLLIAGDGEGRSAILRLQKELGLKEQALLLGRRDDATDLMQIANVMLLPSLYEGLPLVAMEAAATRLPLVASDLPGVREATRDGATAMLHPVRQEQDLADSVVSILSNPSQAMELVKANRRCYEDQFSINRCQAELEIAYELAEKSASVRQYCAA